MAKAPRQMLGVDDLDYADRRLCRELQNRRFGQDWHAVPEPPDSNLSEMWGYLDYTLKVDREHNRATFLDHLLRPATAYGISVAPAVIEALAPPAAPAPKGKPGHEVGAPPIYDITQVEQAVVTAFKKFGPSASAKKVSGNVRDILKEKTPGRTQLYDIIRGVREQLPKQLPDGQSG
jgi:hypothetical protein